MTTRESVYGGLRGTERIAKDPQASVWACPRVRDQTRRSAVRLGLIANQRWNPQFCLDCPLIGSIEPRLHCSHSCCSSVAFHSIALGLPPFVQSRCNSSLWIVRRLVRLNLDCITIQVQSGLVNWRLIGLVLSNFLRVNK